MVILMQPLSHYAGLSRLVSALGAEEGALEATALALAALAATPEALPALRQKAFDAGFPEVVFARLAFDSNRPGWMASWGSMPSPWLDEEQRGGGPTLLYHVLGSDSSDWLKVALDSGLSPTARLPVAATREWQSFEDTACWWKKTRPGGFDGTVSLLEYGVAQGHPRLTTLLAGKKEVREDKAAWNRACMMLGSMTNTLPDKIQLTLLSGFDPFFPMAAKAPLLEKASPENSQPSLHVWLTHAFPHSKNTAVFAWLNALPVAVLERLCDGKSPWTVWPPGETLAREHYALLDHWTHQLDPAPPLSNRAFGLLDDIRAYLSSCASPGGRVLGDKEHGFGSIFSDFPEEEDAEDEDDLPWRQLTHFINAPRPGEPVIEWPIWQKTVEEMFSSLEKNRPVDEAGLALLEKVCDPGWTSQLSPEGQSFWAPLRPVFATLVENLADEEEEDPFDDTFEGLGSSGKPGMDGGAALALALHALKNPAPAAKKGLRL